MQADHAPPHGRVVASAAGTAGEVALKTTQLAGGGDQPVAEIGVAFEEFGARHGENLLPSGRDWVPGPPAPQPPAPYCGSAPMSLAKLFRARLRRLFSGSQLP